MSEFSWFVAGVIAGYITNILSDFSMQYFRRAFKYFGGRLSTSDIGKGLITGPFGPTKEKLNIGNLSIDWIVLSHGDYSDERIKCFYDARLIKLQPDLERLKRDFLVDWNSRMKKGEANLPYNSSTYKLKEFDIGYREIIDGEEIPVLKLSFGPTDYFTQIVTDLNIHNPIRDRYAATANITSKPVSEFSTIIGINLNLITSDGYLIITNRNPNLPIAGGRLWSSVAEGLLRPTDADSKGAPDLFRCAIRGTQEELGVGLKREDIMFTTFGVHPQLCQYSIIGYSKIQESCKDVEALRSMAIPKDKWENSELIFVPCNPKSMSDFILKTRDRWFSIGLASAVFSLIQQGYTAKEVSNAFNF